MTQAVMQPQRPVGGDGLACRDVQHGYDGHSVLEGVSLEVKPGELLAVIGPSGTGKTTLLRLLAGFEPPQGGTISIAATDLWSVTEGERLALRRRIAKVFQAPHLFDTTVGRNVAYGRHLRRSWADRLWSWVPVFADRTPGPSIVDALETVNMDDAIDQSVRSLSGGEAQRVAFARAIACDPEYLLLDEPTSDLDPRNTAVIEAALDEARRDGLGAVLATHDMHQAERIADRVAVMLEGRIIEVGPTERVFSDPTDPRARQFIDGELVYS